MALIRYPGSKEKIARNIWRRFPDAIRFKLWSMSSQMEYREPFFGAGAIGFLVLDDLASNVGIWLNDVDPGIVALWSSVKNDPDGLISLIESFEPSAEHFAMFKNEDGRTDIPRVMQGFRKLALHQISFSGLGFKAGGPLGGKDQDNASYPVDCRWNPERLKETVRKLHKRMSDFFDLRITNLDFSRVIQGADENVFIYADPPYYEQGPNLYKHWMDDVDHERLASLLKDTKASWVLSYDDHPFIRSLYDWASIEQVELTYTIATETDGKRPKNKEILISPRAI